jgi:hypothetical protein
MDAAWTILDGLPSVDNRVRADYYKVAADYYKVGVYLCVYYCLTAYEPGRPKRNTLPIIEIRFYIWRV